MPHVIQVMPGDHISVTCKELVETATKRGERVEVEFNGITFFADPCDTVETAMQRYKKANDLHIWQYENSEEGKKAAAERLVEQAKEAAREAAGAVHDEAAMREAKPPRLEHLEDLSAYIDSLVKGKHDYGTCVYAMALAAQAAFEYVSRELGVTGFQASCADLSFLSKVRRINGPFILLKAEDMLYPQYHLPTKLQEAMDEWKPWLKEEAEKKLKEPGSPAAPRVREHWERLAR